MYAGSTWHITFARTVPLVWALPTLYASAYVHPEQVPGTVILKHFIQVLQMSTYYFL